METRHVKKHWLSLKARTYLFRFSRPEHRPEYWGSYQLEGNLKE